MTVSSVASDAVLRLDFLQVVPQPLHQHAVHPCAIAGESSVILLRPNNGLG